jgi:Ca-activated chloride channel family protein
VADVYPRTLPDLFVDDELRVFARVRSDQTLTGPLQATLHGKLKGQPVQYTAKVASLAPQERRWVGQAWGQARVTDLLQEIALLGEREELKNEAIELALVYNFITPYTSFLAIPASELTDSTRGALEAARERKRRVREAHPDAAALSRSDMPPGDPVISVRAPRSARQVMAVFPFGLTLDLAWDPMTERWTSRFLVPKHVKDGVYQVEVWIERRDGELEHTRVAYTIDSTADEVVVHTREVPGGLVVRVLTGEDPREVRAILSDTPSSRALLAPGTSMGCSAGFLPAEPGPHRVRVVVTDTARNERVEELTLELTGSLSTLSSCAQDADAAISCTDALEAALEGACP